MTLWIRRAFSTWWLFLSEVVVIRVFLAACLMLASAAICPAKDIYIAQSGAGRSDGADCANALAYSYFNDAANWGSGSCILFSGRSYLVLDGGSNGVVEETDNGSARGHQDRHTALYGRPCNHCEFKNLSLSNICVHSLASDDIGADGLTVSGPGVSMHDISCSHASGCFTISVRGAEDSVAIYQLGAVI